MTISLSIQQETTIQQTLSLKIIYIPDDGRKHEAGDNLCQPAFSLEIRLFYVSLRDTKTLTWTFAGIIGRI